MCLVYGAHNVITKSTVYRRVQRFKVGQTSASDKPQSGRPAKRRVWYDAGINKLIDRYEKCLARTSDCTSQSQIPSVRLSTASLINAAD